MFTAPQQTTLTPDIANKPRWAAANAVPAREFGPVNLPLLAGQIPAGLRGTLYRNGPGRLERGGEPVPHWFDGDGAILAVQFQDGGATGRYRYVQTAGWQAEEQAGRYLYSGYGQLAPGPFWRRWGVEPKNAANTSVLALPDRLLALWEGGHPYRLDLETLATLGTDNLQKLASGQAYSAHPKRDPQSGEIYNFGLSYGKTIKLNLYRSDVSGDIRQTSSIPLDRFSLIHDFTLAGPYLVFLIPPLQAQPLGLLLGLTSFSQAFQWQPQLGTQILIIDRQTLQVVKQVETEPWFQWHLSNAYLDTQTDSNQLVVDYVRYENWATNQWLAEVVTGHPRTPAPGYPWRLRLDVTTGRVIENHQLLELSSDFPIVPSAAVGQPHRVLYHASHSSRKVDTAEMFNAISRLNLETGATTLAQMDSSCYVNEPILAPDRLNPDQTWLLTLVFDGNRTQSSVQIFNADDLAAGPVCVLGLPEVIPFGFHGTWSAQA